MALTKVTYGLLSADTSAIDLNIDANTLYVDSSANKVGIQTNSPSLALEVNDTSNVDGEQISIKGHANYGGTVVFRRGDSFNWRVGVGGGSSTNSTIPSSYFGFEQGNTASMVIAHTTGRVGIGTVSPGVNLDIESNTNNSQLELTATDGTNQSFGIFSATGNNSNGAGFYIQDKTASGSPVRFKIKSNGFIGIGTVSPLDLLHLNSTSGDVRQLMNAPTDSDAEIKFAENGTVKFTIGNDAATDSFVIGTTNVDTGKRFEINSSGVIKFNGAYTFPTSDGSANQVLQTDGSGALSFATVSGLPLSGGTLTGPLTTNGVINTGTSHNFAINTPNSLRINIDSDNNNSGEVFVVGHNQTAVDASNNVLFSVLAANGNVGMGTGAPGAPLDIETAGNTQDGTYYSTVTINNTGSNTFSGVRFDRSGVAKWRVGLKNNDIFQISNLFTGGSSGSPNDECFNITNNSRVGIGTASPSELLEVNLGDIKVQGGANASTRGLIIAHTGQTGNLTMLRQDSSGSRGILETTERNLRISAGSSGGTGTAETLDFFVNGSERMSIDTTGAIQIGGSTNAGFIDFDSQKLQLNTQRHPNTGTFVNTSRSHASIELNGADGGSLIVFRTATSNNTAAGERMRIISDGSVLVNTTVDADNQTMRIRQGGSNADPALSLDSDTGDQSYYRYMKFYRKGQTSSVAKLDIDWSGSSIGLAFTSDARLKTVTGEADGLELITRLNPVKYVWKSEPDRHGAQGFLAQEVEQAYYETGNSHARGVSRPVDGEEHYMLDDTTLIPNLVKAIKELKDENDALKARVEALES